MNNTAIMSNKPLQTKTMTANDTNIDPQEVAKFDALASRWWDPSSEFKPLHDINPLRLKFIEQHVSLEDKKVLDIGCGGGLLAEAMAKRGAHVTGIDMARSALAVAQLHMLESGVEVDYRQIPAEQLAEESPGRYDIVTCMELLEHVPNPAALIQACATLVKPGGQVFLSTLNRNAKSYLLAIIGAEYLLRMLPKGTHDYGKFIRPSELAAWLRKSGLQLEQMVGMGYNPITQRYAINDNVDVNYLVQACRPQ